MKLWKPSEPWKIGATIAWLLFLFSVPLWLGDLYILHILIITGIFIIAAMSLNLLLGYTGQLSLGHVAFFGIGAYVSSLVSLGFEVHLLPSWLVTLQPKPVWFGMALGIVFAGACGWVIGKISFKVRGAYFVIVSVSFAEVVRLVALNWVELTQGPMALNNIPALRLGVPGWFELSFLRKPANYYLVLVVAVLCYVLIRRLVHSRAGRAMIALRENEPLATSVGVDVTKFLVLATVVSAAMAGAAGALYAHYVRIVDPDVFLFIYTVTMVIMVISGGKGTLAGPIVGGLIFGLLPEVLRAAAIKPEAQWVVYGVLMILVVYFLPDGIVPAVRSWWQRRVESVGRQARHPRPPDERERRHRAGRGGPHHPLRRADRRRRHRLRGEERRGALPHRPQRRGQDHGVQCHHRLHRAGGRRDPLSRHAPQRPRAPCHCGARRGAHVPEDQRVHRPDRARQRGHRSAPALQASDRSPSCSGCPPWRARRKSWRARWPRSCASSGWRRGRRKSPPRCPTASCGCWRWLWRWRRGRSSCCSTSRCPA